MALPYQLPATPHVRLRKSPLQLLLGQIRYPPIMALADIRYIAPFQEALRGTYPEFGQEQQLGLQITPTGTVQTEDSRQWRLASGDGVWVILVNPSGITLQSGSSDYTDYGEFRSRFAAIWDLALVHFRPSRRVQQGLRYVNHIEGDLQAHEWSTMINPELLGPIGSPRFGNELRQAICELVLERPNGQFKLKHGIAATGPDMKRGYLLDFDYLTQQRPEELSLSEVLSSFDSFHELIYGMFRWSITPRALKSFQPLVVKTNA